MLDLASRAERRLTTDGSATVLNGVLSFVYWEEIFHHDDDGFWWSDDSQAIAFLRSDESRVDVATFTSFKPAVPEVITQRYPRVGRPNPEVRLGVVDLRSGRTAWMEAPAPGYEYVIGVTWQPDSRAVAVQTTDRAQTRLDVLLLDRAGATRRLLTDLDPAWVNQKEIAFVRGSGDVLISSERDGWTHLYRYAADGTLRNAVTRGSWSVRGPRAFYAAPMGSAFVDAAGGWVYFTASEKSPIERHLYRVAARRLGHDASLIRARRPPGQLQPEPPLLPRCVLEPRRASVSHAARRGRGPPDGRRSGEDGHPRALRSSGVRAPDDPGLRRTSAAGANPQSARLRRDVPLPRHPAGVRRDRGAARQGRLGPCGSLFDQVLAQRGYVVASIDNRTATAA